MYVTTEFANVKDCIGALWSVSPRAAKPRKAASNSHEGYGGKK
jgi:hypothetical protein